MVISIISTGIVGVVFSISIFGLLHMAATIEL